MRLIDADTLFTAFENAKWHDNNDRDLVAEDILMDAPTIDPTPKGMWMWSGYRCEWGCSVCNKWIKDELMPEELYNYCPNCGAKIERIV